MIKRRNTATTAKILSLFKQSDYALSHDMIEKEVDDINRATIYRVLNRFCEDGITHKITDENGKQYFALCKTCSSGSHNHNHFHFQCTVCDKVECFTNELGITLPKGYQLEQFNGMLSGVCNTCN